MTGVANDAVPALTCRVLKVPRLKSVADSVHALS